MDSAKKKYETICKSMSSPIVSLSAAEKTERINRLHRSTRHRPGKKVPVTGRSARYYQRALYPDGPMVPAVRRAGRRLLDLGSGCNHLHPRSLLLPSRTLRACLHIDALPATRFAVARRHSQTCVPTPSAHAV